MDVSSLGTWICGLLVPDTDSVDFIHIQNAGSRRHQALLSVIGSMIGPDENSQLHFLFLSDWSCHISCSYDFKRHCLPANSLLITLHQCLFLKTGKREPYYKSGMPLENFHFTVPIFFRQVHCFMREVSIEEEYFCCL